MEHLRLSVLLLMGVLWVHAARGGWRKPPAAPEDVDPNFASVVDMVLKPFRLGQVRLLDGRVRTELEINRRYLRDGAPPQLGDLKFDAQTILHLLREVAGLPAPGEEMGHTESVRERRARGQFSGHLLSAFAMMYACTGDKELKRRSDEIIAGLAEVQKAYGDGYLSAFPKSAFDELEDLSRLSPNVPYYCEHKLLAGLWDQYRLCGNKQALDVLKGVASWCIDIKRYQRPSFLSHLLSAPAEPTENRLV